MSMPHTTYKNGTGVFYQAMPSSGVDGKKIMKLIPVQMVNGHVFQTQLHEQKTHLTKTTANVNIFTASVKELPNVAQGPPLPGQSRPMPLQQIPLLATQPTNSGTSQSSHMSVILKSPALPQGQYLQIPPNAVVRTVPASELPSRIKNKIFPSQANSVSVPLPNVVYVSPVTTVAQNSTSGELVLKPPQIFSKTSDPNSERLPPERVKTNLKLVPKYSQRPNSPTRWVVEEVDDSSTLNDMDKPQDLLCSTSRGSQAVAGMGNVNYPWKVCTKADQSVKGFSWAIEKDDGSTVLNLQPPTSTSDTSEVPQTVAGKECVGCGCEADKVADTALDQENALVMCNGKVYFVSKKCHLATDANAKNSIEVSQMTDASQCLQHFEAKTPHTIKEDRNPTVPNDVIDLCGDDDASLDDSYTHSASTRNSDVPCSDEDHVIFVSYSPPKSQTRSPSLLIAQNQQAVRLNSEAQNCSKSNLSTSRVEHQQILLNESHPNIGDSEERSNLRSQQGSPNRKSSPEADVLSKEPVVSKSMIGGECLTKTDTKNLTIPGQVTQSLPPRASELTPHLLKQQFQIKAEVKIFLQRIDKTMSQAHRAQHLHTQLPKSTEQQCKLQMSPLGKLHHSVEPNGLSHVNELEYWTNCSSDIKLLEDSHLEQRINSPFALKQKCHPGQSQCISASQQTETGTSVGCMNQDFHSAQEKFRIKLKETVTLPQTLSLSSRRMARTRKRTMCSCCSPFTPNHTKTPPVFPEEKCKKGKKIKTAQKDSGACNNFSCPTSWSDGKSDSHERSSQANSATFRDPEGVKQQEQIRRLKNLRNEKDAAEEKLRNV